MKKCFLATMLCLPVLALGQTPDSSQLAPENLSPATAPPMLGIHWARDFNPSGRAAEIQLIRRSANMINHGGKIMPDAITEAIFWGASWHGYSGDKITGMDTWYTGFSNSNYAKTSDEY